MNTTSSVSSKRTGAKHLKINKDPARRVSIPSRGSYRYTDLANITYMEADSNYTRLYLADGTMLYTSKTLKYWQELIDSELFLRIHSKYLVNSSYVTELNPKGSCISLGKTSLIISRSRKAEVIQRMKRLTSRPMSII